MRWLDALGTWALFSDYVLTQLNALVANVCRRAFDKRSHLILPQSTEGTVRWFEWCIGNGLDRSTADPSQVIRKFAEFALQLFSLRLVAIAHDGLRI